MLSLQLVTFGIIIAALALAWGLLMATNPTRFWDLARVDWNADVVDVRDRHRRHLVRMAGWIISGLALAMIVGLVLLLLKIA